MFDDGGTATSWEVRLGWIHHTSLFRACVGQDRADNYKRVLFELKKFRLVPLTSLVASPSLTNSGGHLVHNFFFYTLPPYFRLSRIDILLSSKKMSDAFAARVTEFDADEDLENSTPVHGLDTAPDMSLEDAAAHVQSVRSTSPFVRSRAEIAHVVPW